MIEFAMAAPMLVFVFIGVVSLQNSFNSRNVMVHAAREGARAAARFDGASLEQEVLREQLVLRSFNATIQSIQTAGLDASDFDVNIQIGMADHPSQNRATSLVQVQIRERTPGLILEENCISSSYLAEDRFLITPFEAAESFDCGEA